MPMIVKLQIPISPTFDFSLFLAEPTDVREWNLKGLPSDAFSVENGVLVTRGRRWPLMVDPQVSRSQLSYGSSCGFGCLIIHSEPDTK